MAFRESPVPRERLRVVWRILLWLLLLLLFYVAGQYAVSFLPGTPLGWATYVFLSAGGLMAGWAVLTGLDGRPPGALGFAFSRAALTETVTGLGLGGGLIATAVVLLVVSGGARFAADAGTVLDAEGARCYARRVVDAIDYEDVIDLEGTVFAGDDFQRTLVAAYDACA